jgi:hypothetical protein
MHPPLRKYFKPDRNQLTMSFQPHEKKILGIAFIFSIALYLILSWNTFNLPLERDEGEYAYSAWIMHQGFVPYHDSFMQKPPMIIYTFLLSQILAPDSDWMPRLLAALFVMGAAAILGLHVSKRHGVRAGSISMILMMALITHPALNSYAANTEKFMLLPLIGCLVILPSLSSPKALFQWALFGALATLAMSYKPIALMPLLIFFLAAATKAKKENVRWHQAIKIVCCCTMGIICILFLVFGFFIFKGGMTGFWETNFRYNAFYATSFAGNLESLISFIDSLGLAGWSISLLLTVFIFKRHCGIGFYILNLFAAGLSILSSPMGHYYILLVPFLAVLCSIALDTGWDLLTFKFRRRSLANLTTVLIISIVLLTIGWPLRRKIWLPPSQLAERLYHENLFFLSPNIARRVASITRPDSPVFVAGSEPQILYYAKRRSPTRFVIMYPLTIPTPVAEPYQEEAIAALVKNPPQVIVFSRVPKSWALQPQSPQLIMSYLAGLIKSGRYQVLGGWNKDQKGFLENSIFDSPKLDSYDFFLMKKKEDPGS